MEGLKVFAALHLDKLPAPWVTAMWEGQFLVFEAIPEDYVPQVESAGGDLDAILGDVIKHVKRSLGGKKRADPGDPQESGSSWQTLTSARVEPRPLLALLGSLIKTGQDRDYDEDARQSCLLGTRLYLTLLAVPGSSVYEVFHENLFQLALDTFKLAEGLIAPVKRSRAPQDLGDLYEEEDSLPALSNAQKQNLTRSLNTIMYETIVFLGEFSLLDLPRSLEAVVAALVDVTKLGGDSNVQTPRKNASPPATLGTLTHNAYVALTAACHPRHGPIPITIKLIIKKVLVFMTQNCYNDLNAKLLATVRKTTIHFLSSLVEPHQEAVEAGILILMNQIMIHCSKIAEDRRKEVSMIIDLLRILRTRKSRDDICGDFLRCSHNSKITWRIFAQEILNKYLKMSDDLGSVEGRNLRKILLGTVLCHCNDVSSLVRAKCVSTLSEYTEDPENLFVRDLFTRREEGGDIPVFEELEEAMANLSEDLDILPEADAMISMLTERVEDERAAVRISAIQILHNFVKVNEHILTRIIDIISEHCRDPTMTVRIRAIQVLTSLFQSFPRHESFCTTWVKSVVPQVFDVEVNVQVEALKALESLTLKRISPPGENVELPWRVLNELTRNKMRKHLAKACDAWTESGSLTNSILKSIKSQIGSEYNIEAWIFLSAVSESQVLEDMQQHFRGYEDLFEADDFLEPVFEVLRSCCLTFEQNFLEKMLRVFLRHLQEFRIHERLISISLDIVHQVSDFLKPTGEGFVRPFEDEMTDLLEASEMIISSIIHHETSGTTCIRAIYTLGYTSLLCPKEVSLSVLRILQGLLVSPETIPTWFTSPKRLQACAIVALGQQSMRKEAIAHEMMTIFAQLLCTRSSDDASEDAAIRVNAAKALADVATRFTSLVEPHLPDICVSMKDGNPIVREAIVVIFIQLLVEDYIKVKGTFFFHILTMLADPEKTIREMTVFLIKERLLMKNKELISQQFLEAIYHYNDFETNNKFCKRTLRDHEKVALVLSGGDNAANRRLIYDFMLENLDVAGKSKLHQVLTTQIFNNFLSGNFKVTKGQALCVLRDALYVVSSVHLQVGGGGRSQGDDEEEVEGGRVSGSTNVHLEKTKKHRVSVLLPKLAELRRKLTKTEVEGDVGRAFVKIAGEFGKDQLTGLFAEFPGVEEEMERCIRLYGKRGEVDDEVDESSQPLGESTPIKQKHLSLRGRSPRIVLRRLSSLTYPGLNHSAKPRERDMSRTISSPVVVLSDCVRDLNLINAPQSSGGAAREAEREAR
ncbi:condensin-2 complex subunit D3 [Diachasma alloeum]|uniref:condensin-2 complex subunit D3 n=1 Tax=Diachasma alloeum TaxID=454923 RepID=UPI0007382359|nr:condensin-2 complex subunit D3 [Diachasma alloeum]